MPYRAASPGGRALGAGVGAQRVCVKTVGCFESPLVKAKC
jgi:hypothetical protein